MADEGFETPKPQDDLPAEAVEARKRQTRLNALTLAAVLLLSSTLPAPYSFFTPILFLIPLVTAVANRLRQAQSPAGVRPGPSAPHPDHTDTRVAEPYSFTPKDPKDPRRYKPIG